jgi:hypothetical protein
VSAPSCDELLERVRAGQKIIYIADSNGAAEVTLGYLHQRAQAAAQKPVAGERPFWRRKTYEHPSGGWVYFRSRISESLRGQIPDLVVLAFQDVVVLAAAGAEIRVAGQPAEGGQ